MVSYKTGETFHAPMKLPLRYLLCRPTARLFATKHHYLYGISVKCPKPTLSMQIYVVPDVRSTHWVILILPNLAMGL